MSESSKYGVILADPAWQFRVWNKDTGQGRSAEAHYRTMPLEDMKRLPIADLAAPNCALLMWAVWPSLPDAIALGQAWGFEYKTIGFDWIKTRAKAHQRFVTLDDSRNYHMGMGYYTRANTEPCLLFTRGRVKRLSKAVRMLVVAPVQEHSRKPDEVHKRIEQLFGGPYLEMFARRPFPGWDLWGNEVESTVQIEAK